VNLCPAEEIAKAVLYEGYMLYPYRPSSVKNQQRFNFGVLCPQTWCDRQPGSESSSMQTECLLRATAQTRLTVRVAFLQIVDRLIGRFTSRETQDRVSSGSLEFTDQLEVDGRAYRPWQEVVERSYTCEELGRSDQPSTHLIDFDFPEGEQIEIVRDAKQRAAGAIVRRWKTLAGSLAVATATCREGVVKLTVRVENRSTVDLSALPQDAGRDFVLPQSLVSAHIISGVENGEFLSLLEPPAGFEELAAQCENRGVWPVLANDDATIILASPIILYDDPRIAPESAGNLFDATEIDEILSLRILTLTDGEKQEIRQSDDRARELLERTENIPDEQFMKLHGALRGVRPLEEAPK